LKAIVYTKYGPPDVLKLKEVEEPVPKDDEVLIRVYASTITPMDWRFREGKNPIARLMAGPVKPKNTILGVELAGEVEAVGTKVKLFKKGDQVFGGGQPGAHAEYICMPEDKIAMKPLNMTYEEAAAVHFAAGTALGFLRDAGNIKAGQKVLINGASGGVGTFAVQLAKYYDTEVTGVCSSTNLEMVQSLGADIVIDYTKEDFTKNDETYDIIFDTVGKRTFAECKNSLCQDGIYLSTVATIPLLIQMIWTSIAGSKKAKFTLPVLSNKDLVFLKDIIEAGKLRTIIDRSYPLGKIVEAHQYSEKGHAKGKVVVTI